MNGASPRGFSGFVSLTALRAEGCGLPLWAMLIKSALRDLLSVSYVMISTTVISHLRWLFPPFGALRHHLPPAERWDNKDSQSNPFISCTTISTGCSATACGGSPAKRARGGSRYTSKARLACFPTPAGRLYGFIQTGAFYNLEAPYNNPRARGASNLSPLRTFGPAGRQPSSPIGRQGGCIVFAAKGGIKNGAEGAVPPQWARSANQ